MDKAQLAEANEYIVRFKEAKNLDDDELNLFFKLLFYMERQNFKPAFLRSFHKVENDLIYRCFFWIQLLIILIGFLVMLFFT